MKFGLFGSAQAKRGGPDVDSAKGYRDWLEYNTEAEAKAAHPRCMVRFQQLHEGL